MRRHRGPAGLSEALAAAAVAAVTLLAVLLPRLAGAPPSPVADLAVTAGLGACAVRLLAARRRAWAAAYAVASLVWTAVGLAPLLPPDLELAVSRWALVPLAIVVTSLAVLVAGRWAMWAACSGAIALAAGSGLPLPPLMAFGVVLLAAVALTRGRRAGSWPSPRWSVSSWSPSTSGRSAPISRRGSSSRPSTPCSSGSAALVTCLLTDNQLARAGFEPTGEPGDVTRWLAKALGSSSLAMAFPDGDGSRAGPLRAPASRTPVRATPVQDADGQRDRLAEPTDAGRCAASRFARQPARQSGRHGPACVVGSSTRPTR